MTEIDSTLHRISMKVVKRLVVLFSYLHESCFDTLSKLSLTNLKL